MGKIRRRAVLVVIAAAALTFTGMSASAALGYGKATWQTALTGTFVYPGTGSSFGFWGWCDFAGGVTSGNDADCQVAESVHTRGGSGWTCELTVTGTSWNESVGYFFPFPTFHVNGSLTVRPGNLTEEQKDNCIGFYVTGDQTALVSDTTLHDVDTFIPTAAGHYDFNDLLPLFGGVGEFNFTVAKIP